NYPFRPQDRGFGDVVCHGGGGVGQTPDFWGNDYFDDTYYRNGKPEKFEGYCTDVFFNETMRFIREKKDEPFFIYLAPNITHLPLKVAEKYSKKHVDNGIDEKLAILYGMIDNLDENMGRLLACLKETGVDEKTIILMTTDDGVQGASISRTPDYWNMGMRGKKGSQEEGGHRVFSYLRWIGGNIGTPGFKNNTLISIQDVYPTMLDLCGLPIPRNVEFSGRSFKPYLTSPLNPEEDDRPIFFYYYNPKKIDQRENQTCVIWKNWRLIANTQLYDISKDKMQENDVAADYPEVVKKLQAEFDAYHASGKPLIQEPVRFIIGDPRALVQELTSQDVYWTQDISGGQAFGQGDCEKLEQAHGPYKVAIARDGKYTFTLSRYPLYTGMTFGEGHRSVGSFHIEKVCMSIAGQTVEKAVTPEDTHARFTLDLKAGDADLDTALIGDGNDGIAYFVTIEFSGESS
ncbi:MAG: sulfatase-like hydrolase/transferase, partial [Pirellulales bacterium]|nr:sulfatase-like hydrolase/transferase [Pirellulales bacterium]